MTDNRRYWLWFAMAFSPGNDRIWELLSPYDDVVSAYESIKDGSPSFLNEKEKKSAKTTHIEQCDSIIEYCENKGYDIVTFEDENYPSALKNIYNPPAVLFCMGDMECLSSSPCISCVGTRKASDYGREVTEKICGELAMRGFTIVSGFALGLDSAAHRSALAAGGKTCAVLACGLDVDYPKENAAAKKIIASHGVVITEYFPGKNPDRFCFHIRNRIIAGLSFGTLVTEAPPGSGSLITAQHTAEQGKALFCVPPANIFDKRYAGVIKYLRDGAIPVFSHLDILYEYYTSGYGFTSGSGFDWPELSGDGEVPLRGTRKKAAKKQRSSSDSEKSKKAVQQSQPEALLNNGVSEEELSDEQIQIVNCIREKKELLADEISELLNLDTMKTLTLLTELEIMGVAEHGPDKRFRLL
jgi:DNA processing protein